MKRLFEKIFGSFSDREIKRMKPTLDEIDALGPKMEALSEQELKGKTKEFQERLENGETLEDILAEAFAVIREAAWRVLGMKHFNVQLIGGLVLNGGNIAEMRTGEGKTLMATLPVYLNALEGKGVHVVTVNDYLAKRDRDWMGKVYEYLGLSVGCILHDMETEDRRAAYSADITYGTNNEFGFDYLRDNMVIYKEERVQRELNYAIVDEIDSILVDEARTPLIISGQGEKSTGKYKMADVFVRTLTGRILDQKETQVSKFELTEIKEETVDFTIDEKAKNVTLTEKGVAKAEKFFGIDNLADAAHMELTHHINQALKAHNIMHKDVDYVIKDGEIVIVDDFTGRLMFGRRYSEGLHQAIEAKEGMEIKRESKTLATITFQNYFRMYNKLSGMTGTAKTEEEEFRHIYNLNVIEVPTNRPVQRQDETDVIYKTEAAKFNAVIEDVKEKHAKGQPVLVGTVSIRESEELSKLLKRAGIKHEVLNAKQHEREAEIVSQAGRYGAVTIATNMAGRGTDISLGGNAEYMAKADLKKKGYSDELIVLADSHMETDDEDILRVRADYDKFLNKHKEELKDKKEEVLKAGGLRIIGTERHESRRIDNQLRGRAGRQGDPGSSKFYISLDDDLMRLFTGERIRNMVDTLGMPEDEALEHPMLARSVEGAQRKVEGRNFGIRKHVLQYDDVMNKQRQVIYEERRKVLEGENLKDHVEKMMVSIVDNTIELYTKDSNYPEEWDIEPLKKHIDEIMPIVDQIDDSTYMDLEGAEAKKALKEEILKRTLELYNSKEKEVGLERFREIERVVLLKMVDIKWIDHIDAMDQLRQGIGLRAMGNEDPVRAYQNEGFDMFEEMINSIQEDTVKHLFKIHSDENIQREKVAEETGASHGSEGPSKPKTVVKGDKVGRNDDCPCGSGKKYKKCCGKGE